MLRLARTTPKDQVAKRTEGLSVFVVDMREAVGNGLTIRPIRTMVNHSTTEVLFDDLVVPAENLIGEEGKGFRYILDGMNAARLLISHQGLGEPRWLLRTATEYATSREVCGRSVAPTETVPFPVARPYARPPEGAR